MDAQYYRRVYGIIFGALLGLGFGVSNSRIVFTHGAAAETHRIAGRAPGHGLRRLLG